MASSQWLLAFKQIDMKASQDTSICEEHNNKDFVQTSPTMTPQCRPTAQINNKEPQQQPLLSSRTINPFIPSHSPNNTVVIQHHHAVIHKMLHTALHIIKAKLQPKSKKMPELTSPITALCSALSKLTIS